MFSEENERQVPTEFPGFFSENIVSQWLYFSVSEKMIEDFGKDKSDTRKDGDSSHDKG